MKKILVAFILVFALVLTYAPGVTAEMAMEGSGPSELAYHGIFKMLSMGRNLVKMNWEVFGVSTGSPPESPLYMTTCHCMGSLYAVKGVYNDSTGFCVYVRPDGDKIFMTLQSKGALGGKVGQKGTFEFVGGTGKCEGITGGGEYNGIPGFQTDVKGSFFGMNKTKVHWKIEAKK